MIDLSKLSDRELLLYVHQDLKNQITAVEKAVLTEIDGVRVAVERLEPVAGKVDALISDVRGLDRDTRKALGELKLAHVRIVELEAVSGRRRR